MSPLRIRFSENRKHFSMRVMILGLCMLVVLKSIDQSRRLQRVVGFFPHERCAYVHVFLYVFSNEFNIGLALDAWIRAPHRRLPHAILFLDFDFDSAIGLK